MSTPTSTPALTRGPPGPRLREPRSTCQAGAATYAKTCPRSATGYRGPRPRVPGARTCARTRAAVCCSSIVHAPRRLLDDERVSGLPDGHHHRVFDDLVDQLGRFLEQPEHSGGFDRPLRPALGLVGHVTDPPLDDAKSFALWRGADLVEQLVNSSRARRWRIASRRGGLPARRGPAPAARRGIWRP